MYVQKSHISVPDMKKEEGEDRGGERKGGKKKRGKKREESS